MGEEEEEGVNDVDEGEEPISSGRVGPSSFFPSLPSASTSTATPSLGSVQSEEGRSAQSFSFAVRLLFALSSVAVEGDSGVEVEAEERPFLCRFAFAFPRPAGGRARGLRAATGSSKAVIPQGGDEDAIR